MMYCPVDSVLEKVSGAGPRCDSLLMGHTAMKNRPDRHRLFTEWAHKYGPISQRRLMYQHVCSGSYSDFYVFQFTGCLSPCYK